MWFAPIGVCGLVAWRFGDAEITGTFYQQLRSLAKYAFVVAGGLLIHGCITLPAILFILTRRNPFVHMKHVAEALLCAVSTASSSATLPVTIETLDRNAKVSRRTSGFVATLGATINMDGTALYEAVAVVFIAQALNYDLSMVQIVVIFLTATLAAIGAAGIPEAGLVTMLMVLAAVGIPFEGVGLIFAIDWFLDRLRTTVNVWGDCVGCAIIDNVIEDIPPESVEA
jgi:Na+/H+-dicarboxylate symporter